MAVSFDNEPIALLTQHGKERVIAPVLEPLLHCRIEHVSGYDTDQLGSFSRDIARPGSQLEAARRKAQIGMRLSGLPLGLASEGSFGPDPFTGMFLWNIEMVVLIDQRHDLEIVGIAQGQARSADKLVSNWDAAATVASLAGFPEHQMMLRPDHADDPRVYKGIGDWASLEQQFALTLAQSSSGQVFIESDLRAHANPTRMENIRLATIDLGKRLTSSCPQCATPGYGPVKAITGLPCARCHRPTSLARGEQWHCSRCGHDETIWRRDLKEADPRHCDHCNP